MRKTAMIVERERVDGACASCGAEKLERYPAISEGGWYMVTKCSACLVSAERLPWNRLGYVERSDEVLL